MALHRIFFICDELPRANEFQPNIKNIKDLIPNTICCVRNVIDPLRFESDGDEATIVSLLELLRSPDIQPSIRKSTLLQLNMMASNPKLNQIIYNLNGWIDIIMLLEMGLQENSHVNLDEIIPAIGLISKFCLQHPLFRSDVLESLFIFIHLIRALLIFYSNVNLKQDASVALFLFLFHDYVVGGSQIKVPLIVSKLKIPILTEFYGRASENYSKSEIEKLFLNKISEPVESQFFRQQFASLWFQSFDEVLKNVSKCMENDTIKSKLDYRLLPGNAEKTKILKFNNDLYLIRPDINLITSTAPRELLIQHLDKIMKGSNFIDVANSIHSISTLLLLQFDVNKIEFCDLIITVFSQYYSVSPNTASDVTLFINILNLLSKFINYGFDRITYQLLVELRKKKSVFDIVLNENSIAKHLFIATVSFMRLLVKSALSNHNKEIINLLRVDSLKGNENSGKNGLIQELFESITNCIHKIYLNKPDDFGKFCYFYKLNYFIKIIINNFR